MAVKSRGIYTLQEPCVPLFALPRGEQVLGKTGEASPQAV